MRGADVVSGSRYDMPSALGWTGRFPAVGKLTGTYRCAGSVGGWALICDSIRAGPVGGLPCIHSVPSRDGNEPGVANVATSATRSTSTARAADPSTPPASVTRSEGTGKVFEDLRQVKHAHGPEVMESDGVYSDTLLQSQYLGSSTKSPYSPHKLAARLAPRRSQPCQALTHHIGLLVRQGSGSIEQSAERQVLPAAIRSGNPRSTKRLAQRTMAVLS